MLWVTIGTSVSPPDALRIKLGRWFTSCLLTFAIYFFGITRQCVLRVTKIDHDVMDHSNLRHRLSPTKMASSTQPSLISVRESKHCVPGSLVKYRAEYNSPKRNITTSGNSSLYKIFSKTRIVSLKFNSLRETTQNELTSTFIPHFNHGQKHL